MTKLKLRTLAPLAGTVLLSACTSTTPVDTSTTQFTVLSANTWLSLNKNFNGNNSFDEAVKEFKHADADVILLSEAGGVNVRLAQELGMHFWQGSHQVADVGILSRYPIKKVFDARDSDKNVDHGGSIGALLDVNGQEVVVWSNHLDWTNYITYDARGGNGETWAAREECVPVSDSTQLDTMNRNSRRPAQMEYVLEQVQPYIDRGAVVIFGGDFNEPSGMDWTEQTSDMFDHSGTVHDFMTHKLAREAGFTDSYRELYPDPVSHPGISWPIVQQDSWTAGDSYIEECGRALDDRDRIDFIYYQKNNPNISLKDVAYIGPRANTFFTGPQGKDSEYQWQDPFAGIKVEKSGEPQYQAREFISDHLWYKANFELRTPSKETSSTSIKSEPQFSNVTVHKHNDGLEVSFSLTNLALWDSSLSYTFDVAGDRSGSRSEPLMSVEIDGKPSADQLFTLQIPQHLVDEAKQDAHNHGLDIRLTTREGIASWKKQYSVHTISFEG
jgi:endonuclease/exonuclease/phosphatase (EEP) superfamily protein YafD